LARLGRLADRVGPWTVVVGSLAAAAVLLVPQAAVAASWQLVGLRFLMGAALGGLLPCMASVIRHSAPEAIAGSLLGCRSRRNMWARCSGRSPAASSAVMSACAPSSWGPRSS
jgi:MFS family permease